MFYPIKLVMLTYAISNNVCECLLSYALQGQIFISIDVKDSDFTGEEKIETFQEYFKAKPGKPSIPLTLQGKRVK